jgi:hypothetical protein
MKRTLTLLAAVCILGTSVFASGNMVVLPAAKVSELPAKKAEVPVKNAADILIPVGKSGQKISLLELSQMKVKDFEKISGKEMKFTDKIGFKIAQKELRNSINNDGTINNKKLNKFLAKAEGTSGFHLGGFALGFLLGLIGVLIAYLINDDKKSNRVKWAWIGLAAIVVLWIIIAVAA